VDIRLRRFNYPLSVRDDIFKRIKSEREKKKADYETEGEKLATDIKSEATRQARDIDTRAKAQKKVLEEEAAVKADVIRNEAHSKDPEFYTFLQKLEAYQTILGRKDDSSRDMLLLSTNHELFDLLLKPPRPQGNPNSRIAQPKTTARDLPAASEAYEMLPPPRISERPAKTPGGP
jgi:membrane protease subunit HflC